jgi:LacI family transcriptional regulator
MPDSQPLITQRDLARKLGVSNATISLALRDSPRIAEARRKEIQAMAEELGYRPNPSAVTLSHNKRTSKTTPIHSSIAWLNLWPEPDALRQIKLFGEYWKGGEACAEKFGYRLEEFALAGTSARLIEKILSARGIEAVLLSPQHYQHKVDLRDFRWENFCAVRTSRLPLEPALHVVTTDQAANTMLAIDQMRAKGYNKIGFINYGQTPGDRIWRFESGYLTIQQELPERERLPVYRLESSDPASRAGLAKWMKLHRPDALLTLHANARETLESIGYRVPDDVGLAAVNTLDCQIEAGIDQIPAEVGRCAVLQLLSLLHDNDRGIPANMREILIKGRWVDGPSLPDRH